MKTLMLCLLVVGCGSASSVPVDQDATDQDVLVLQVPPPSMVERPEFDASTDSGVVDAEEHDGEYCHHHQESK